MQLSPPQQDLPFPPDADAEERWSPGYGWGLLIVAGLILYGSLFPFRFIGAHAEGAVAHLLSTWTVWDQPGDFTANILLYLPLGFCTVQTMPRRAGALPRILLAALLAAGMAACVELTQFFEPARVSTLGDVYANALGAALGGAVAAAAGRRIRWPLLPDIKAAPDAAVLVALFVAYRLYPYVPTESVVKYRVALSGLVYDPRFSSGRMIQLAIAWLLVAAAMEAVFGRRRWLMLFPLFALLELGCRILVLRTTLQWTDVGGAVLGGVAWLALPRSGRSRPAIVAVLLAGLLCWLPFAGLPWSAPHLLVPGLFERAFLYGGLIWAVTRCGTALWTATGVTCALLVLTAALRSGGDPFNLTGIILALAMGGALALLRWTARPPRKANTAFSPTPPTP